ncbi:MAG: hypothetical protein K8S55_03155 [Phycisphaerae bacterium]|nr:hypothetical protein [Phycisphaerae bacterium]
MAVFNKLRIIALCLLLVLAAGCSSPAATLELLSVGREALASARTSQEQSHAAAVRNYQKQLAALDAAFDADVRLAAAGGIKNAAGKPVGLSADWVISARKGYAAVRNILAQQAQAARDVHAVELDNLRAGDEALQMAAELTIAQWNIAERLKQEFRKLQNRIAADKK